MPHLLVPLLLSSVAAGNDPLFAFTRTEGEPVLSIRPDHPADFTLDPRLCGNFLEHLGGVIYEGVWAQCLVNPTLEPLEDRSWEGSQRLPWLRYLERITPLPWVPDGKLTITAAGDATVNQQALRLETATRGALVQDHTIPLHRARAYRGRLFCRSDAPPNGLRVYFARVGADHQLTELAATDLPAPTAEWKPVEFTLTVAELGGGNRVRFGLEVTGPGSVEVDNIELFPADAIEGMDPDIIRLAREWRMPILRYPGGNFVSGYHWRDGVGPHDRRPTRPNLAWGNFEYNQFGTDEFMRFCELIGTKPMICVNIGNGTPEEAAAWVEYCHGAATTPMGRLRAANGHPEPYGVRVWEVGNEIYGSWQIGHCDAAENVRRYNAFAPVMRAADPTIELIANGQTGPAAWNDALLRDAKDLTCISEHPLVGPWNMPKEETPEQFWPRLAAHPYHYGRDYLPRLHQRAEAAGRGTVTVAVTEWGIISGGREERNILELPHATNLAGAIYAGCLLNALLRSGDTVPIANITGLLHGGGLRKRDKIAYADPQYYVSLLYVDAMGGRPVECTQSGPGYDCDAKGGLPAVENVPWLDAAAVLSADGQRLWLYLVNRAWATSYRPQVSLDGFVPEALWRVESPGEPMARNSTDEPTRVATVRHELGSVGELELPAMSVTRVDLVKR